MHVCVCVYAHERDWRITSTLLLASELKRTNDSLLQAKWFCWV